MANFTNIDIMLENYLFGIFKPIGTWQVFIIINTYLLFPLDKHVIYEKMYYLFCYFYDLQKEGKRLYSLLRSLKASGGRFSVFFIRNRMCNNYNTDFIVWCYQRYRNIALCHKLESCLCSIKSLRVNVVILK